MQEAPPQRRRQADTVHPTLPRLQSHGAVSGVLRAQGGGREMGEKGLGQRLFKVLY